MRTEISENTALEADIELPLVLDEDWVRQWRDILSRLAAVERFLVERHNAVLLTSGIRTESKAQDGE